MLKKLMLTTLLLLPTSQVLALDCNNAMTQLDMNQCANSEYKKADTELNRTYKQVLAKTSVAQRALLKSAQLTWIKYRDADCTFQSSATEGGSVHPMIISACLTHKTEERTAQLKSFLNCPEGDLSCPL
ncbi:lysozyme inhibitor LprI family protein [Yersinia sp. Marseille-Q3913]|uniref:lysozyme inhibitor LprI family protein n=1 Tax=Yersinia sp. Marseille-Q3913 TaxID=2830769 RepID=UPI001BAFD4F6|nr:lysozyme inhibitor LprI family protein [Yersinia sp. Marseille-Q3913]MBS0057056.1 lysozyme inhibitor LprI family protein [Yersinia sp. Marseille-Q3913]